jgi:outer membrane receptor protein involved in Fe transport
MQTCPTPRRATHYFAVLLGLMTLPIALCAQTAPIAPEPKSVVVPADAVKTGPLPAEPSADEAVELSPFVVTTEQDKGFVATNAGTATRLSLDMADVPAAYSVMTRDFIDALGLTNIQEATYWATNGAPIGDGNGADVFGITTIANIRGIGLVNGGSSGGTSTTRNNYLSAAIQDSYNLERYDFGRGPNAALFNIGANSALGGGMGAVTKSPRYYRAFTNIELKVGTWDYKRSTIDINRPLTDKFAIRVNAVWFDRGGWKRREFEKLKGVTVAGSYRIDSKTELRVEGSTELTERTNPQISLYDAISGWDGVTVFDGPITNAMFPSGATPGAPNGFGQTLTLNGEPKGVNRRGGGYYIWSPASGQNMIMNYQNEAITRRADETANTPLYSNGQLWVRGSGLAFGNGSSASQTPAFNNVPGGEVNFLYQNGLPGDRFARAISGSKFRSPDKRDNDSTDEPILRQRAKDANIALTRQIGDRWFFEFGGDVNETKDRRQNINDFRTVRIDINQTLPNGAPNPNFLLPYADGIQEWRWVKVLNRAARANVAYRTNLGKWGNYLLNFNASLTYKNTEAPNYQYSMRTMADPRLWNGADDQIRVRHYWYTDARPFGDAGVPTTVFRRDFAADNNTWTTSTRTISPKWTLSGWSKSENRFLNYGAAGSAKYFGGRLVVLSALRFDNARSQQWTAVNRGDLPSNWDGETMLFLPDAPSDWAKLTYIPRDANGNPTSTVLNPAATRPRTGIPVPAGATTNAGVSARNPFYANDRFRDDYSPPINRKKPKTLSTGAVYHFYPWLSLTGNYATSYVLPPTGAFDLSNDLADVQTGEGYDAGLRFRFFGGRLNANLGYFFNIQENVRVTSPIVNPINALLGRNDASDGGLGSRNNLGVPDIFGSDYASQRNSGGELEVVASLKNGLRLSLNVGSGKLVTFDRFPLSKSFMLERADVYRQVLEAAGGRLDTTQRNPAAPSAPGLAVINPAVTPAIPGERTNAITDYNNIWTQYEVVLNDAPFVGSTRITANVFVDYTLQSGRLRGLRAGLGAQYRGDIVSGYRTGDSTLDANGNVVPLYGTTAGLREPVYSKQPMNTVASLGYSTKLKGGFWRGMEGKQISFQVNVNNLLNKQGVFYQDDRVTLRPPNGDLTQKVRESVPDKNAVYQQPISVIFTTTLKL